MEKKKKVQVITEEELEGIIKDVKAGKYEQLGEGSYKKAYKFDKFDEDTVITLERLKVSSLFKEDYDKLMTGFYNLPEKHLNNILLPYASGDFTEVVTTRVQKLSLCSDEGVKDLFDLLVLNEELIYTKEAKTLLQNGAMILETIFELHKNYITCMDIKMENTFVNCSKGKNYITLGDADGFKIYDNVKDMFTKAKCIATPSYLTYGKKLKNHHTLGGPTTDYFAWLRTFLYMYFRLYNRFYRDFHYYYNYHIIENYAEQAGKHTKKDLIIEQHNNYTKLQFHKAENQELIDLILKALEACVRDELYDIVKKNNYESGEEEFYDTYIKPIVDHVKEYKIDPISKLSEEAAAKRDAEILAEYKRNHPTRYQRFKNWRNTMLKKAKEKVNNLFTKKEKKKLSKESITELQKNIENPMNTASTGGRKRRKRTKKRRKSRRRKKRTKKIRKRKGKKSRRKRRR